MVEPNAGRLPVKRVTPPSLPRVRSLPPSFAIAGTHSTGGGSHEFRRKLGLAISTKRRHEFRETWAGLLRGQGFRNKLAQRTRLQLRGCAVRSVRCPRAFRTWYARGRCEHYVLPNISPLMW